MIVLFFIIVLEISFVIHIYFLVNFLSKRQDRDFRGFFITTITNIFMGIFIAIFTIIFPAQIREINVDRLLFVESGVVFVIMIYVKGRITMAIYRRAKDPNNYHFNVFGKKVLHGSVATMKDVMFYFLTLPFTLICGAYFVTKLACTR